MVAWHLPTRSAISPGFAPFAYISSIIRRSSSFKHSYFIASPPFLRKKISASELISSFAHNNKLHEDTNQVRKSLLISAICCMIAYVWAVIVGLSVRSMNPSLEGEMATGWLMDQMPVWVVAVFSGLVVCTILSTISSGVQSVVVNLNRDIYRVVKPDVEDKKAVKVSRILSVVIVFTAALVAMFFPQVLSLLVITYSYSAAGLVCPIFLSYILRKKGIITKNGIVAGMLSGILVCAISMQFNSVVPYVIWGCLASGIAMIVFSKLDKTNPVYLEK